MKEKKTVLAVVLGVSIVSLITAIVATTISTFTFFDYEAIAGVTTRDKEYIKMGFLQLIAIVTALTFLIVFVSLKKKRALVNWILMGVTVGYILISTIGLRIFAPTWFSGALKRVYKYYYELFLAYFTPIITIAISTLLVTVSSFLLERENKKEQPTVEPTTSEAS